MNYQWLFAHHTSAFVILLSLSGLQHFQNKIPLRLQASKTVVSKLEASATTQPDLCLLFRRGVKLKPEQQSPKHHSGQLHLPRTPFSLLKTQKWLAGCSDTGGRGCSCSCNFAPLRNGKRGSLGGGKKQTLETTGWSWSLGPLF